MAKNFITCIIKRINSNTQKNRNKNIKRFSQIIKILLKWLDLEKEVTEEEEVTDVQEVLDVQEQDPDEVDEPEEYLSTYHVEE